MISESGRRGWLTPVLPHHRSCGPASGGSDAGTCQHAWLDTGTLGDSVIPSVTHLSSGGHPLSSNCFQHVPIPVMLYYRQPPGPSLHQFSLISSVLWPRLTSVGSIIPYGMGYTLQCISHRPPRIRCNSLPSMQPPHLRDRVRVVWDFDLCCSLDRSAPPSYAISGRRLGTLPAASFRSHLTMGTLAVRLTLPTTKRVVDFHHQAIAHGGRTTEKSRSGLKG